MQLQAAESQANKDLPSIQRIVNMQDGQGGFIQVGVDSQGNPLKNFGPPKPWECILHLKKNGEKF